MVSIMSMLRIIANRVLRATGLYPAYNRWRKQRRKAEFYAQFVRPGELCFDVGANVGDRVRIFLSLGARVVAIDPQPSCVTLLRRTFAGERGVAVEATAVGAEPGEAELYLNDEHYLSSMSREWIGRVEDTGRFGGARWAKTVRVPVTTLDALIDQHGLPSFCKIDVEGFEHQVLLGLSRLVPAISFEFTWPEHTDALFACAERLASIGPYRFNYSLRESMQWASPRWLDLEELRQALEQLPPGLVYGDIYARLA
jgi:FkbM family methyltransferase